LNSELFAATIGGLGLTGVILDATLSLFRIESAFIEQSVIKFGNIEEFFSISSEDQKKSSYTVAWIDCLAKHEALGRGHFISGEHSNNGDRLVHRAPSIACPFDLPQWVLNRYSVGLFNTLYYNRQRQKIKNTVVHYDPFFYPLDSVYGWNRIYGKQGFVQFQCIIPRKNNIEGIKTILKTAQQCATPSFLAVLKEFGSLPSPGLLSFPREGVTLCLDFAFRGEETVRLMKRLEAITVEAGGALYPAKDSFMSKDSFHRMFPNVEKFLPYMDPTFSSSFIRRVL